MVPAPEPNTDEAMLATVLRISKDLLSQRGLSLPGPHSSLRDAGLSSLDLVSLVLALEETCDVVIPEEAMTPAALRSPASLAELLSRLRRA